MQLDAYNVNEYCAIIGKHYIYSNYCSYCELSRMIAWSSFEHNSTAIISNIDVAFIINICIAVACLINNFILKMAAINYCIANCYLINNFTETTVPINIKYNIRNSWLEVLPKLFSSLPTIVEWNRLFIQSRYDMSWESWHKNPMGLEYLPLVRFCTKMIECNPKQHIWLKAE